MIEPEGSKIIANSAPLMSMITDFGRNMEAYESDRSGRDQLMSMLVEMSPAKLDSEIGTLDVEGCCTAKPLIGLLRLINDCLESGLFWDAAQGKRDSIVYRMF